MIAGIDIWRAANLLVKRHGRAAVIAAAQRADEFLAAADSEVRRYGIGSSRPSSSC
jgi:hypothetical protein